jgi:hypothetical protein
MKRQQKFITTVSLIVALSGLSSVVAADEGMASGHRRIHSVTENSENSRPVLLSHEQMDGITAGRAHLLVSACQSGRCFAFRTDGTFEAWNDLTVPNHFALYDGAGAVTSYVESK